MYTTVDMRALQDRLTAMTEVAEEAAPVQVLHCVAWRRVPRPRVLKEPAVWQEVAVAEFACGAVWPD